MQKIEIYEHIARKKRKKQKITYKTKRCKYDDNKWNCEHETLKSVVNPFGA